MNRLLVALTIFLFGFQVCNTIGQELPDWEGGFPDGCTSITCGKLATVDGSVITSHTDDSHRTRSWIDVVPPIYHKKGDMVPMYKRLPCDSFAMPTYAHNKIGEIPQVEGNEDAVKEKVIEAHRVAIEDERRAAAQAGAKLFESEGAAQESGEAKRIRFTAETATLTTIAQTSAQALERALRYAAIMIGANPDEVTVTPNLEFVDQEMQPSEAEALVRVWQEGAISYETLYDNLQRGGIASAERSYEDDERLIEAEEPERLPTAGEAGMLPPQSGEAAQQEMTGDAPQSNS